MSIDETPGVPQRAVAEVAHKASGDVRQVLANGPPIVKKGNGHLCCQRWILLFGERHAWRLFVFVSHHHKVDGQRPKDTADVPRMLCFDALRVLCKISGRRQSVVLLCVLFVVCMVL